MSSFTTRYTCYYRNDDDDDVTCISNGAFSRRRTLSFTEETAVVPKLYAQR